MTGALVVLSAFVTAATAGPVPSTFGPVVITGFVGGWHGPGWWDVEIDAVGNLRVSADSSIRRQLTPRERSQLEKLVAALPRQQERYRFGAPGPVDATPTLILDVRVGEKSCNYGYSMGRMTAPVSSDLVALVALWQFLRGLFESKLAFRPSIETSP